MEKSEIELRKEFLDMINQNQGNRIISNFTEILLNMMQRGIMADYDLNSLIQGLNTQAISLSHSHKRSLLTNTKKRFEESRERKKYLEKKLKEINKGNTILNLKTNLINIKQFFETIDNFFWEKKEHLNKKQLIKLNETLLDLLTYLRDAVDLLEYLKSDKLNEQDLAKLKNYQTHISQCIKIINKLIDQSENLIYLLDKKHKETLNKQEGDYLLDKKVILYLLNLMDIIIKTLDYFDETNPQGISQFFQSNIHISINREGELMQLLKNFEKELRVFQSHKSNYNVTRITPLIYSSIHKHNVSLFFQAGEKSGLRVTYGLILNGLKKRNLSVYRIAIAENSNISLSDALIIPKSDMGSVIRELNNNITDKNYKQIEPIILDYVRSQHISKQIILLPPYFWKFFEFFLSSETKRIKTFLSFGPGSISKEEVSWEYLDGLKSKVNFFARSQLAKKGLLQKGIPRNKITLTTNMFNENLLRGITLLDKEVLKQKYFKEKYKQGMVVFSTIGRISGEKNLQSVFSAMKDFIKEKEDVYFLIIGDVLGIESEGIKPILDDMLKDPICAEKIVQIKEVEHKEALESIYMSDVTFAVSGREACNTLTIEALALGTLPIVLNASTFPGLFIDIPKYVKVENTRSEIAHEDSYYDSRGTSKIPNIDETGYYRINPGRKYWRIYIPDLDSLKYQIKESYNLSKDTKKYQRWTRRSIEYAWHNFASNKVLNKITKELDK